MFATFLRTDPMGFDQLVTQDRQKSRNPAFLVAGALIIVHLALAWIYRSPGISWGEDDAMYLLLAGELQHGRYAEPWYLDPQTHARYPPGLPALLSVVNVLTGGSIVAHTVLMLICSGASIALLFLAVRRHFGDPLALFVTGLMAINVIAVSEAGIIMAEAPFRFWISLTLWAASRVEPQPRHLVLAGSAAVIAALTRSVGVAVIAGLALHWFLERRWKAVALLALGSVPVVLWNAWTIVAPDPDVRGVYLPIMLHGDSTYVETSIGLAPRMFNSFVDYGRAHIPGALSFIGIPDNLIDNIVWLALAVVTVPLGTWIAWRRWRLLVLLVIPYGVTLLVWPWALERFVSPVSALLFVLIGAGVLHLVRRWSVRAQHAALAGVASLFVLGALRVGIPRYQKMLACDRTDVANSPSCLTTDRRGLLKLSNYVRENTPPNATFFAPKEAAFYLHTGRRSIRRGSLAEIEPDSLGPILRRNAVSHAIVSPIGPRSGTYAMLVANACRDFEQVAVFEGNALLLRVRETRLDHDDETCRLLGEWKEIFPTW